MRRFATFAVPFLLLFLYACDTNDPGPSTVHPTPTPQKLVDPAPALITPTPDEPMPTQEPPVDTPPGVSKVMVLVGENHGFNQTKTGLPWLWEQAGTYAVLMNHKACGHPSLKNYISFAAGDCYPSDDKEASGHNYSGKNVFFEAIKKGNTARIYVESLSTKTCPLNKFGSYGVSRHVPWDYFRKEAGSYDACKKNVIGLYNLQRDTDAGTLPNVGMTIPNNCSNSHDCSLSKYDAFLKKYITILKSGPDYQQGRLLICSTFDEDNRKEGNHVFTACIHEALKHKVVTKTITHYSVSRMFSQFGKSTPLLKAKDAPDLVAALGLTID